MTEFTPAPRRVSNLVMGAGLVVLALAAGLVSSHVFHAAAPVSQQSKMQAGLQATPDEIAQGEQTAKTIAAEIKPAPAAKTPPAFQ